MTNNVFNPSRLTFARKRAGLTKTELANRIGVDLRTVSGYEGNEYAPSEDVFRKIQAVLDFPEEFFYGDDLDEISPDTASFRALSKMAASQRDMALTAGSVAAYLNAWLETKFELPVAKLPDLSHEPTPEIAADSLRRYWGIGELPVRNMIHLLEAQGIRVFSLAVNAREVDAFSAWKNDIPFIFLNLQKSSERSRYDAAHELGHLILHRHASPSGREAERQADIFAGAFLMPRASVLAYARPFATLADLVKWKEIWTTSVAALNYRLHEVGLLSDWNYRNLCIQIAERGYRSKEPNEARRETSQILHKILMSLHEEGISRAKLAAMLGLSRSQLEQLVFGLVMTGIEGGRSKSVDTSRGGRAKLQLVERP